MALFTQPTSFLFKHLFAMQDALSKCPSWQTLSESADEAEALSKITVGVFTDPETGEYFTLQELENEISYAHIIGSSHTGIQKPENAYAFDVLTSTMLCMHRQARQRELDEADGGMNDLWLYASDLMANVAETELIAQAQSTECLYIEEFEAQPIPTLVARGQEAGRGQRVHGQWNFVLGRLSS